MHGAVVMLVLAQIKKLELVIQRILLSSKDDHYFINNYISN